MSESEWLLGLDFCLQIQKFASVIGLIFRILVKKLCLSRNRELAFMLFKTFYRKVFAFIVDEVTH